MGVRTKNGKLEYRFQFSGHSIRVATGLEDTPRNRKLVEGLEATHRRDLREGRLGLQPIKTRSFSEAIDEFLEVEKINRMDNPNTWLRIKTSSASLKVFFGKEEVSIIDDGDVERYKIWR